MATSSSILSTHEPTPPRSERRTVSDVCPLATLSMPRLLRLRLLPSSPRVDRDLRLLDDGAEDTPSTFPEGEGLVLNVEALRTVLTSSWSSWSSLSGAVLE